MKTTVVLLFFLTLAMSCRETEREVVVPAPETSPEAAKSARAITARTPLPTITSLQTNLNVLFSTNVGGNNYVPTSDAAEAARYALDGQSYYVPRANLGDATQPLYRLYNGTRHMPSVMATGEANYAAEGVLGYPWRSNVAGTSNLFRAYNPTNGDFVLTNDNAPVPGYTTREYLNVYGYPRYRSAESLLTLQGDAVTVTSNRVAGGVVWELWWNGKQFIDQLDYGREMQSSLNLGNGALPTEGGDRWADANPDLMHGSPLLEARNEGKTQVTKAIPLEWNNEQFNATGQRHELVIYPDFTLGKRLTLDQPLALGEYSYLSAQIISYQTTFSTPTDLTEAHIEIPTAYLTPDFNRFFEVDATRSNLDEGLTEVALAVGQSQQAPEYAAGGIVIATAALDYAMGVYVNVEQAQQEDPNAVYYFRNWRFGNTAKWSAGRFGTLASGENTFRSYVVVGTLDNVRVAMRMLYANGY